MNIKFDFSDRDVKKIEEWQVFFGNLEEFINGLEPIEKYTINSTKVDFLIKFDVLEKINQGLELLRSFMFKENLD